MLYNIYSPSTEMYISQDTQHGDIGDINLCGRAKDSKLVHTDLDAATINLSRMFFHHLDSFHDLTLMVRSSEDDQPKPLDFDPIPNREEILFDHALRRIVDCKPLRIFLEHFNIFWSIEDRVAFNNSIKLGDMLVYTPVDYYTFLNAIQELNRQNTGQTKATTPFINLLVDTAVPEMLTNWNLASQRLANVCIVRPENQMLFKLGMHPDCKAFMVFREPKWIFA